MQWFKGVQCVPDTATSAMMWFISIRILILTLIHPADGTLVAMSANRDTVHGNAVKGYEASFSVQVA